MIPNNPIVTGACIQQTGWALRDKLIELGLLRPGIDCATTLFEEELEAPPPRWTLGNVYVFKQYPTYLEREAEAVRARLPA